MNMEREIKRVLDTEWREDYLVEKTANGHYKIVLNVEDEQRTVFAPSTPSDWRSLPNAKAQLRRAMRELRPDEAKPKSHKAIRKRSKHRSIKARRDYSISDQLRTEARQERRTFQMPAPLEPHQREVTARRLNLMSMGGFDTPKERVVRKPKKGSPEHRAMMSEKMRASWARRKGTTAIEAPKLKAKWGSDEWRERLGENLAKARAAAHTPEANRKRSESMKAARARRKAEQANAPVKRGSPEWKAKIVAGREAAKARREAEKAAAAAQQRVVVGHGKRLGQPVKVSPERHQHLIAAAAKARAFKADKRAARLRFREKLAAEREAKAAAAALRAAERAVHMAEITGRPRVRVKAISVRVPAPAPAAPSRVSAAREARLSRRNRVHAAE